TTAGTVQTTLRGLDDSFVAKLNATGSALLYATYLGNGSDRSFGIAVDAAGNAYVTGQTTSTNFPTTAGAVQTASGGADDAFVAKLNAPGSALLYSTYLGANRQLIVHVFPTGDRSVLAALNRQRRVPLPVGCICSCCTLVSSTFPPG